MLWNLHKSYIDSFACADYHIIKCNKNTRPWSFCVCPLGLQTYILSLFLCSVVGKQQSGTLVFFLNISILQNLALCKVNEQG